MSLLEASADADPRASNHGGHTPTPTPPPDPHDSGLFAESLYPDGLLEPSNLYPDPSRGQPLWSRFDWYECTVENVDDERVPLALAIALGGSVARRPGRNGYAQGWEVSTSDGEVLALVYGRSARAGEVHISVPGAACLAAVPVIRRLWPLHGVSRVDSACDFIADFEHLDALALSFAQDRGLSYRLVTDSDGGATRYIGSPRSELMVRLYKKTEQLRAKHPDQADQVPDGVVRAEAQARPGKRALKQAVATFVPDDVWGLAQWSALFAVSILALEPVRTSTHFRRSSDWTRSLHWLGQQYGPMVQERRDEVGREAVAAEVLRKLGI